MLWLTLRIVTQPPSDLNRLGQSGACQQEFVVLQKAGLSGKKFNACSELRSFGRSLMLRGFIPFLGLLGGPSLAKPIRLTRWPRDPAQA